MKKYLFILSLMATVGIAPRVNGQDKTPATLRSILLEQFQTTWDHEDWFVPVKQSLEGLSAAHQTDPGTLATTASVTPV